MKVNGKVIVVTGAGGGVGRELVLDLLKKGASVAALDINEERLNETAKIANNKEKLATYICDITDVKAIDVTLKAIVKKFGVIK